MLVDSSEQACRCSLKRPATDDTGCGGAPPPGDQSEPSSGRDRHRPLRSSRPPPEPRRGRLCSACNAPYGPMRALSISPVEPRLRAGSRGSAAPPVRDTSPRLPGCGCGFSSTQTMSGRGTSVGRDPRRCLRDPGDAPVGEAAETKGRKRSRVSSSSPRELTLERLLEWGCWGAQLPRRVLHAVEVAHEPPSSDSDDGATGSRKPMLWRRINSRCTGRRASTAAAAAGVAAAAAARSSSERFSSAEKRRQM